MNRVNLEGVLDFESVTDEEMTRLLGESRYAERNNIVGDADILDAIILDEQIDFDFTDTEWEEEIDRALDEIQAVSIMDRGIGFCENEHCPDFEKGVFLFLHEGNYFRCGGCEKSSSHLVPEKGIPEREGKVPFSSVRVEFNYNPITRTYSNIISVTDDGFVGKSGVYTIQNPLCKTEGRAMKLATNLLSVVNERFQLDDSELENAPRVRERILSFDKSLDDFKQELKELEECLTSNPFLQNEPVVSAISEVETSKNEGELSGPKSNNIGGKTDEESRVSSRRENRGSSRHLHPSCEPGSARERRTPGRLPSMLSLGRGSQNPSRVESQGRRTWDYRKSADELRAASRRIFSSFHRSPSRGTQTGTQVEEELATEARDDSRN